MHINIQREELLKPLSVVAGVVERRQTLPILSNILVRVTDGELRMTGTDLEVEVVTNSTIKAGGEGETTLPARKLLDICRALPSQAAIELRQEKDRAIIKSGKSRFKLLTMPAGDFPAIETAHWEVSVTLPQRVLKRLLEKTLFCMAQQDVRYYLNGLLVEVEGRRIRAVATDGHRMALSEAQLAEAISIGKQVIVPRKGVQEMVRFLEDSDDEVEVQIGTNHLRARLKGITFTSKLIDGRFPDYTKVIPMNQTKHLRLDREAFRETLNRAAILSNEKYRGVRFSLGAGMLKVTAHNPEQEEAQEELSVEYDGEELEIGFNVNYIADAVNALDSAEVEMGLNDSNSSCTLGAPGSKQYQYVVMPMRL